ncbi:MAG: prepilin-type N-terminal cleavage/methylation domain-containing protein [Phycisphaerales bacterium]|jgi:prepilin-type N-terminal cleavage/methylation domain-containing protein|nr:prepilin-type N-terminal cleavage/methylation domain-containing protein [Phycisphaerales bacterium]
MTLSRRAFSLIELVMAVGLSAIIAAVAMGFFFSMTRADAASAQRTDATVQMSRIHRALQRTFRTMLLDTAAPRTGENRQARISLVETALGPRLELTLTRPPVLGLIGGKPMDPATQHSTAVGALELRRPFRTTITPARTTDPNAPEELELWWTPYDLASRQPVKDPNGQTQGVLIATGIAQLDIRFAKTGENKRLEKQATAEISTWDNVPAFVDVQLTMINGQRASWLIEVAAAGGVSPGQGLRGGVAAIDADLPADTLERLRDVVSPPTASTDASANANPNANDSSPSAQLNAAANAASEAQRLREALALAFRLIAQLQGGGGGDEE